MTVLEFIAPTGEAAWRPFRALGAVLLVAALLALSAHWLSPAALAIEYALYALVAAIVVTRLHGHHPYPVFGAANLVTLARAALVCLLAALIAEPPAFRLALVVFTGSLVVLALDGLDGLLARSFKMASRFGARFDMETDAFLILVLSAHAWVAGKAGGWILLIGLMRYAFVVAGLALPFLADDLPPSWRRKLVCVFQIVVLTALALPFVTSPWSDALAAAALCALAWSFLADIGWLARARPAS